MIGCLRVRKQPIIVFYFEFETVLKFYNLEAMIKIIQLEMLKITEKYVNGHYGRTDQPYTISSPCKPMAHVNSQTISIFGKLWL